MEGLMINRSLVTREQAASPTDTARELAARVPAPIEQILFEVKRLIVGQDRLLERLLIALLSGGHVLLEGVPGLAKTVTVKAFAQVIGGAAGRIQFTPHLVRFMLKVLVDYPSFQEEVVVVERITGPAIELHQVVTIDQLKEMQRAVAEVYVDPAVRTYAATLAYASRPGKVKGLEDLAP